MSPDLKDPKKAPAKQRESTLAFKTRDPGAESLVFPKTERVSSLRERLSNFANIGSTDPGVLNFRVFIDHIDGMKTLSFGGVAFDIVLTEGRSIFLISDLPPQSMQEGLPHVPQELFGKCSSITSLISPSLYLYRMTSRELSLLESFSDSKSDEKKSDDWDIAINVQDLQMKLKGSHVLHSEPDFDLHSFADGITDASGFCDRRGNTVIAIPGSDSFAYTIYLNADMALLSKNSQQICRFLNSGKVCVLCKEEILY